ncbi:MAG: hypothetical protein ACT4PW_08535 [Acidimicrobiia bacterium]
MDSRAGVLRIDCDECRLGGTAACADCIVTYLCAADSGGVVVVDANEALALGRLQRGGLAPALRHSPRGGAP